MRSSVLRSVGVLAMCVLAVSFTGCGSNNKGKIEGKWKKVVSTTETDADFKSLKDAGVAVVWEFKADGTFSFGFMPDNDKPESKAATDRANANVAGKDVKGNYTLGMGDRVTLTGATFMYQGKKVVCDCAIAGDNMTIKEGFSLVGRYVRVK